MIHGDSCFVKGAKLIIRGVYCLQQNQFVVDLPLQDDPHQSRADPRAIG